MKPRIRVTRLPVAGPEFGDILRAVRTARHMSQEDLAREMTGAWHRHGLPGKISFGWVKRIESHEVKSVDRLRIACAAEVLEVPVTRLLPPVRVQNTETENLETETDIVLALRSYGVEDRDIEDLLDTIKTLPRSEK